MNRVVAILLVVASYVGEGIAPPTEYEVKAAYLYNFGMYVTWPEPFETFKIGIVGRDPFGKILDKLATRHIHNRPVVIQRFKTPAEVTDDCQMLFVADPDDVEPVLSVIEGKPILVVADVEGMGEKGAMISFYLLDEEGTKKVKFEINRKEAEDARLKVDFRVLKLGKLVQTTK